MADTWIISSYSYERHRSLAAAEREANRIREEAAKHQDTRYFRIYRVKTTLPAGNTKAVLEAADDLLVYIGANTNEDSDPNMIALASRLQYEVAVRTGFLREETIEAAYQELENA